MSSVAGATRMSMRFTLLERPPAAADFVRLDVPRLRAWRTSRAGVARFAYSQRVIGLRPGADYRALVQFRWLDANGGVVATAKRLSAVCAEPATYAAP